MGPVGTTVATLRFYGDDLEPDEITRLLGAPPTHWARVGDEVSSGRVATQGSWRLQAPSRSPEDLDEQIADLFSSLTADPAVWRELTGRYRADVFCGLFLDGPNEGVSISPATSRLLADRYLPLGLDIYGATEPEDEDEDEEG